MKVVQKMANDYRAIKDLAAIKQKELEDLQAQSLHALEEQLHAKKEELQNLQCMFNQLKQDFKYNLQLLNERDAELELQDPALAELRLTVSKQSGDISELNIRVDQLKDALSQETLAKRELSSTLLKKLDQLRAEHDADLRAKETELAGEKEELAKARRECERQVALLHEELQSERHASARRTDELAQRLQRDHEQEKEEAGSSVLALQLQVKMLTKELEMTTQTLKRNDDEKENSKALLEEAKKKIKELEWQLEDGQAELAFSVKSLQTSLRNAEAQLDLQRNEMHRKIADLDRQNSEKAALINSLKQSRDSNESELQAQLYETCQKLAMSDARLKEAQETATRQISEKDTEMKSLAEQLDELKAAHAGTLEKIKYAASSDKAEMDQLRKTNEMLVSDAESRKRDLERYRKDLIAAVDRATQLEREKAQMSIDWQKQAQALERTRIHEMEQLVSSLTKAKDDALAKVKRQEEQLASLRRIVNSRQTQARSPDTEDVGHVVEDSAIANASLREQNESLRLVIRQMRQEMEMLVQQVDQVPSQPTAMASTSSILPQASASSDGLLLDDYTRALEEEVKHLKATNRHLQLLVSPQVSLETSTTAGAGGDASTARNMHVRSLNETIGMLRSEKVALQAQARKMQIRVDALTSELDKTKQEPAKKQVMVEQLQYELHAFERRHAADSASLRQRVASLELQLAEAQQEADEYYKGMLEKNAQLTALETQLAELQLASGDQHGAGRRVNYGAQELLIQQLQDEVTRLRHRLAGRSSLGPDAECATAFTASSSAAEAAAETGPDVLSELQAARRQIAQVSKEKAVLTELSNRLRAELKKAGVPAARPAWGGLARPIPTSTNGVSGASKFRAASVVAESLRPGEVTNRVEDRLRMMENLQYRQTMNELSRSPRHSQPEPWLLMTEESVGSNKVGRNVKQQPLAHRLTDMVPERDGQPAGAPVSSDMEQGLRSNTDRNKAPEVTDQSRSEQPAMQIENSPLYSSSSLDGGGSSLQDVWKILDDSNSFADTPAAPPLSVANAEARGTATKDDKQDKFVVSGSRTAAGLRGPSAKDQPFLQNWKGGRGQQKVAVSKSKAKIRNYSIKD